MSPRLTKGLHESEFAKFGELFNEADVIRDVKTLSYVTNYQSSERLSH